ncbi:type VI secretion system ImpA/VasJ family protein [Bradyrhizobium sp. USDA 4518]
MDHLPAMLRRAAAARHFTSPADPNVYLLNRIGSWLRFDALPPDTGGRTMISPPDDHIFALEGMLSAGQHPDVVNLAEDIVWTAPFWLDAHRHAAKALQQMGPLFEPAAAVVRAGLALLIARNPRILALQFGDGRPFADEETRSWTAMGPADVGTGRDPVDKALAEAHRLMGSRQPLGCAASADP